MLHAFLTVPHVGLIILSMGGYYYIITAYLQMRKPKVREVSLALGHLSTKHRAGRCSWYQRLYSCLPQLRVTEGAELGSGDGNVLQILPQLVLDS